MIVQSIVLLLNKGGREFCFKKLTVSCSLIVFSFLSIAAQSIYPYLQAPTPNSIYINWKTSSSSIPIIAYGTSPSNLTTTVTGSTNQLSQSYYYHTVQLVNLNPNTKYYYVASSSSNVSDTLSFKTLPLPGEATSQDGHLRFLIMGDNQINAVGRYDTLVESAKRKVIEKWGGDPSDHISLTFMVGDQVDLGNLSQYEAIHFAKNQALSGYVPIQTTVGNHETYGSMGLNAYYSHFYLDQMSYLGITSGTENYYAMQVGNVLFISLSSEHTGSAQYTWLQQVMNMAQSDQTVDWIMTFSHRPYEAEQYVGDISSWVKNTAVPFCMQKSKYLMHVGAHHHIYSRGQFKEKPVYNIISGGTAWDQYWGQSNETDFEYIQKTISNWCYQIIDVDVINGKVDVECYSVGSPIMYANNQWKNNELVDEFHRYLNQPAPNAPTIMTNFGDSLELPVLIQTSPYSTQTQEQLNSTEFQIAQVHDFSVLEMDVLRDYENLFGQAPGAPADSTQDLNQGVNIEELNVLSGTLQNGMHYVRTRHRDRNLEWSAWSPIDSFTVYNSFSSMPFLTTDQTAYSLGSPINVTYQNGPGNSNDWIGIYSENGVPGQNSSIGWQYCNGVSGVMNFSGTMLTQSGMYYAAFFELNGYTEVAQRDYFYYGSIPTIISDTTAYPIGTTVPLYVSGAPAIADSVEVLKVGYQHGVHPSEYWGAINSSNDIINLANLPKGYYSAKYYFMGEHVIGDQFYFSVGDTITELVIDKPLYELGEDIIATWTDAPGIVKDWLGIYNDGDDPNIDPLLIYTYFGGVTTGTITLEDTLVPTAPGDYFIVMFTNDSYTEVSNREYFTVVDTASTSINELDEGIKVYPNPTKDGPVNIISSDYPIEWIQLRDNLGKVVYRTENTQNQQFTMLTSNLPAGNYIMEVQTRKLYRYKLVVQ